MPHQRRELVACLRLAHRVELGGDRRGAALLDAGFVHERCVKRPDFALERRRIRASRLFHLLVQPRLSAIGHLQAQRIAGLSEGMAVLSSQVPLA
jgi:hypothetical protein